MGSLLLVRHGQASVHAENYDRLSTLGEQQSKKLGAHWAKRAVEIDRIYCGPRERQRRSAELSIEAFRAGGGKIAAPEELEDLDEMRIDPLMQSDIRALCEQHVALHDLAQELLDAKTQDARLLVQMKLRAAVMRLWNRGLIAAPDVETWIGFVARVRRALDHMLRGSPKGARLIAFTSAGVIAACCQLALEMSHTHALEMLLQIRNASSTRFQFSLGDPPRFTLATFNELPHLADDPAMVTLL